MPVLRSRILATVTATGGATQTFFTSDLHAGAEILAIRFRRGTTATTASGFSTNAHISIAGEQSGIGILEATATDDVTWYPRGYAVSTGNIPLGFSSNETSARVPVPIPVAGERIRVIVSSAGAASGGGVRGIFDFYLRI